MSGKRSAKRGKNIDQNEDEPTRKDKSEYLSAHPTKPSPTLEINQSNIMSMFNLPGEKYSLFLLTDLRDMLLGWFGLHRGNIFH